jgi:hypothetical protein
MRKKKKKKKKFCSQEPIRIFIFSFFFFFFSPASHILPSLPICIFISNFGGIYWPILFFFLRDVAVSMATFNSAVWEWSARGAAMQILIFFCFFFLFSFIFIFRLWPYYFESSVFRLLSRCAMHCCGLVGPFFAFVFRNL